ncbi:MAG: type IV pilus modification protein PilV [Betaproteobacteria bacterium]|nr:type IV pilus modification protein PilV [Betaproteobacteria bacterium]NBY71777.1 type IV pilus modification protein PilV [Betaproteobacteria bacterium]NDD14197.1 type IV pilus modification protein PilV [Betaproteobacteria bacterium]
MKFRKKQTGASLLEVLIATLILSFGLLAMGIIMASAIQLPKLSAMKATATQLANSHIDRIRANAAGFKAGHYDQALSYDGTSTVPDLSDCSYPNCTPETLALMDRTFTLRALRQQLPAGGMLLQRDTTTGSTTSSDGHLWVIWQEPGSFNGLTNTATSDNCPSSVSAGFTDPVPRCVYIRFRI